MILSLCGLALAGCGDTLDTVPSALFFYDPMTDHLLEGVEAEAGYDPATSNANGRANVEHPLDGAFSISVSAEARPDHRIPMEGYGAGFSLEYGLISDADIEAIGTQVGLEWDHSKAIVEVTALWLDTGDFLTGMSNAQLGLDASFDAAIAEEVGGWAIRDSQSFSVGDRATMAFVNVEPGIITATLDTTLAGTESSCGLFPSDSIGGKNQQVEVNAGEVTVVIFLCSRA